MLRGRQSSGSVGAFVGTGGDCAGTLVGTGTGERVRWRDDVAKSGTVRTANRIRENS